MSCPRHDSGLVCQVSGSHRDHAAWGSDSWVYWSEPDPEPSPFRTRRPPSKADLIETVHRLETDRSKLSAKGGPATSASAASTLRTGSQKYKLLVAYAAHSDGLTDEEAANEAGLTIESRGWWQRCADLRNEERIVDTGRTRESPQTGESRMVCQITELGKGVLDATR